MHYFVSQFHYHRVFDRYKAGKILWLGVSLISSFAVDHLLADFRSYQEVKIDVFSCVRYEHYKQFFYCPLLPIELCKIVLSKRRRSPHLNLVFLILALQFEMERERKSKALLPGKWGKIRKDFIWIWNHSQSVRQNGPCEEHPSRSCSLLGPICLGNH